MPSVSCNLGRFIYPFKFPLDGDGNRCKQETPDVGKVVCRPREAPVGEAVDRLGHETLVYLRAFYQG